MRLKGGDVFVFARGGEEARALHAAGVPFEIVPGITSAIAAPAYAGIPVTHRDHNTTFSVSTGHEDPTQGLHSSLDFAKLANPKATTIFLMAMGNLAGIVAELRANGLAGDDAGRDRARRDEADARDAGRDARYDRRRGGAHAVRRAGDRGDRQRRPRARGDPLVRQRPAVREDAC